MALFRKKVFLAKIETVYGTDAVPTAAANAVLAMDMAITPLEASYLDRPVLKLERGSDAQLVSDARIKVQFSVEAAGSGAVDLAPAYGPLIRACGFAETVTPTTGPVVYDPVSASDPSLSGYWYEDGTLHKLLGARGNLSFELTRHQVPKFGFELTGLHVAPADAANPAPTLASWKTPEPANLANTPTFTLNGFAAKLSAFSLNLGNAATFRSLIGSETVEIVDRKPTGQVTIEAPALASKDFFALAKAGTTGALQLIHGTATGKIVQLDAPAVQVTNPRYIDLDGARGLQLDLNFNRTAAGNDEIKFTVK